MKKRIVRQIFFWISFLFLLAWTALIYAFSAQPDTESVRVSGRVSYRIVESVNGVFHLEMTDAQIEERAHSIDFPVRKAAHMTEFAILALLFLFTVTLRETPEGSRGASRLFRYAGALAFTLFVAIADEVHQRFVPGRAGCVADVLIDTFGGFLGLLVVFGLANWYNKRKRKKG